MYDKKILFSVFFVILLIFAGVFLLNKNQALNKFIQGLQNQQNQVNSSGTYNFSAQQTPTFNFPAVAYASDLQKNVSIFNSGGKKMEADITASANADGSSIKINKTQQFTPGKYSLVVNENGKKIEQDFTWGVLAINTNKSIYAPGETAILALAVLDEKGNMVCDADVTLDIKDPTGKISTATTKDKSIIVNPECQEKKLTVNPDYETKFKVDPIGNYQMSLTAVTKNGTYNIVDSFDVEQNADFDIERATATRIYPYSVYPVLIKITAKKDFSGQIKEPVPASFTISALENVTPYSNIQKNGNNQYVLWNISIKKGEAINIGYNYKAPLISPRFYLLGPLSLTSGNTLVFEEKRAWQLAIDGIYSSTILGTPSLVAYWRMGEASGNIVDSKNANNSTSNSGVTYQVSGALAGDGNTAIQFNSPSFFVVPNNTNYNLGDTFSIELWFKRNGNNGVSQYLLDKGVYNSTTTWEVYIDPNNKIVLATTMGDNAIIRTTTAVTDATTWHHVVFTKNGATSYAYLDGVSNGDVSTASNATLTNTTNSLTIGQETGGGTNYSGSMDEIALYSGVLSANDVLQHYNYGIKPPTYASTVLGTTGLVGYWRLGESSGTIASDSTGTYPGTYTGTYTLGQTGALGGDSNTSVAFGGTGYVFAPFAAAVYDTVSIEAWVKWTSGDGNILARGTNLYLLAVNPDGTIELDKDNISAICVSTVKIKPGVWTHVVATKNGAAVHIYVNGVDVSGTVTNATLTSNWNEIGIGGDHDGTFKMNGLLDEVALYNIALTPAQVVLHYQLGQPLFNYSKTILGDNPVAYWRLGEAGGEFADATGNGHTTTSIVGTPTYSQSGATTDNSNTAVHFTRFTDWGNVPANAAFNIGDGPFSVEFWAKLDATGSTEWMFGKWDGSDDGWAVGKCGSSCGGGDGGLIVYDRNNPTANTQYTSTTQPIKDTNWHYYVYTKNGATAQLYADGVALTVTGTVGTFTNNSYSVGIGAAGNSTSNSFGGVLDEVAFYNTVLTPAQVYKHYLSGFLSYSNPCFYTPAIVQNANNKATGTSVTITLGSIPKPENTIILTAFEDAGYITSVSQTGVTWTLVDRSGSHIPNEIWMGTNIQAGASTSIVLSGPSGDIGGIATEWSGLSAASLDQHLGQEDAVSNTTLNTPSIIPGMNGELIVGTVTVNSATLTAGPSNSYSSTAGSPLVQGVADFGSGYLIQSTAASTSTSWTTNASNKSDGVIASFLPAPYSCVGDFLLQGLKMEGIKIN